MTNETVEYVKSRIEDDLNTNRRETGRDYSMELGVSLLECARHCSDADFVLMTLSGVLKTIEEKSLGDGKKPYFVQTRKCGLAVHEMWKKGDDEGLREIKNYGQELLNRAVV